MSVIARIPAVAYRLLGSAVPPCAGEMTRVCKWISVGWEIGNEKEEMELVCVLAVEDVHGGESILDQGKPKLH